jgi:hypothetical protein
VSLATAPRFAASANPEPDPRGVRSRAGAMLARPLVACIVLFGIYCCLSLANDPRAFLGTDTGAKVATLRAMDSRGDLDPNVGYWAERLDRDGVAHPLALTNHVGERWVQVTTLPMLYAAVPLYELGGLRGILILPMLGAVLVALAARALARRLGGDGMLAFWAVGIATPVAVYALDFWEHSLGLAAMLWGVVLIFDVERRLGGWKIALGAGTLFGVAATMRTEALVYAAAAVGVALLMGWWEDRDIRRAIRLGAAAVVGLAIPIVLNTMLERVVLGTSFRTARGSRAALTPGSGGGSRVRDSVITAVGLNRFRPGLDWTVGAAIAVLIGLAMLCFLARDRDRRRWGWYALAGAVLLYAFRLADGLGFVPGLLTASPLAAAGLFASVRRREVRFPVAVALVALPVVWFFQYSGGANPQWGGRYVLLSGTLLAIAAAVLLGAIPRAARVGLLVLALGVTGCGVAWLSVRSHEITDTMEVIDRVHGPVVTSDLPHFLREGGGFYRPGRPWLTAETPEELPPAIRIVDQAGYGGLTLVGLDRGRERLGPYRRAGSERFPYLDGTDVVLTSYVRG